MQPPTISGPAVRLMVSLAAKHFPAAAARDFSGDRSLIAGYIIRGAGMPGNSQGTGPRLTQQHFVIQVFEISIARTDQEIQPKGLYRKVKVVKS